MQSYTLPARLLAGDPGPWSARLAFQVQRQAQDVAWEEGLPKGHGGGWRCRPFLLILCCVFPVTAEGSWAHLLPWGPVDLVVSNPPYVFSQDMEQLAPEIRRCGVGWDREARPERPSGLGLPRRPTPSRGTGSVCGKRAKGGAAQEVLTRSPRAAGSAAPPRGRPPDLSASWVSAPERGALQGFGGTQ